MGFAMFAILGIFLRIFQIFYFFFNLSIFLDKFCCFFSIFSFFNKKTSVSLIGYGFARLNFVRPRSITSGLLYRDGTNLIKNYSQFSFFGGGHD